MIVCIAIRCYLKNIIKDEECVEVVLVSQSVSRNAKKRESQSEHASHRDAIISDSGVANIARIAEGSTNEGDDDEDEDNDEGDNDNVIMYTFYGKKHNTHIPK